MNDLTDPFESPKLLIEGAVEDIGHLEAQSVRFLENCNCIAVEERDVMTGENVVKLRVTDKVPPRLRYTASNILNNLRHSLDQAINCAAVELGAAKRDSYFPFAKDVNEIKTILPRKCKRVDTRLTDYILREFKPYGGGDDFLYAMSAFTGRNKHQITLSLQSHLPHFDLGSDIRGKFTGPGELGYLSWDCRKQELEFARLQPGAMLELHGQPRLPIFIAISGSPELGGDVIATVLNNLASKVGGIVVAIEAEVRRLKSL